MQAPPTGTIFEDFPTYTLRLVARAHPDLAIPSNENVSPEVIIHEHTGTPWEMNAPS